METCLRALQKAESLSVSIDIVVVLYYDGMYPQQPGVVVNFDDGETFSPTVAVSPLKCGPGLIEAVRFGLREISHLAWARVKFCQSPINDYTAPPNARRRRRPKSEKSTQKSAGWNGSAQQQAVRARMKCKVMFSRPPRCHAMMMVLFAHFRATSFGVLAALFAGGFC